jgi:predicted metal-dependent phosphoesterase TrpH
VVLLNPITVPDGFELLDLHNHTHHSYDAVNRLEDYAAAHAARRFDVLAITDHNVITGALELAREAPFPVIVGQEVDTADGELIGLFLQEAVPPGLSVFETARRIRGQGGLVYLQHPFYRLIRYRLSADTIDALFSRGLVDIVEVANGGPFAARANERALRWAESTGLPQGAGSDAHEPPDIGTCVVAVPPGPLEAAALPERLRAGTVVDRRRGSLAIVATKTRLRFLPAIEGRVRRRPRRSRLP